MCNEAAIKKNTLLEFLFYSNYFYGICAVALSVEATVQQRFPLNNVWYFILIFFTTVLYYTYPYIRKSLSSHNPRTNWYTQHYNGMRWNQITITIILAASLIVLLFNYWSALSEVSLKQWLLIFIFPAVAALYYGLNAIFKSFNLRKIGWLKPFVIGFTWAGFVTVYPVLFYAIIHQLDYPLTQVSALLFLKNFMFITVLCVMFDIKDYAVDYLKRLKTFMVQIGLRKTIFYVLFPLSLIGLFTFICYAEAHQFHPAKVLLNVIPFLLLIIVVWSLHRRRSVLYYLMFVDGLMLVKAVCGSIAMLCF